MLSVRRLLLLGLALLASPAQAEMSRAETALALRLVNQHRTANGLPMVRLDAALTRASAQQTAAMVRLGAMTHEAGGDFANRIRAAAIRGPAAENIGYGYPSAAHTVEAWKASSGHNANLLHPAMGRVGLAGAADAGGRMYWTMILAR